MPFKMKRPDVLPNVSMGICILTSLPVLIVTATYLCLGHYFNNLLYWVGGLFIIMGGGTKVAWQFNIYKYHKKIDWLNIHFIALLIFGFLMVDFGIFFNQKVNHNTLSYYMNVVPNRYFLLGTGVSWTLLALSALFLDNKVKRNAWIKILLNMVATSCLLITSILVNYTYDYYYATEEAWHYLDFNDEIKVTNIDEGYLLDGPGTDTCLIMYPGALVQAEAYSPIMIELARNGVDVILCRMPMNIAIFGLNMADNILDEYSYEHWYIAGHSLGGAMASSYVSKHLDEFDGILLLASYTTSSLDRDGFIVVSAYGSEDTVLNKDKVAEARALMPKQSYFELEIEGGNHAGFGEYGFQEGDSPATISKRDQCSQTVDFFLKQIGKH